MTKGIMPGAIRKIIPPGDNDPVIIPCGVITHIAVSMSDSLYDYFAHRSGGIESHFYVRLDGTIEQYRNIFREADAQYKGNSFIRNGKRFGFVSIETEGMGGGKWTIAQLESIKSIILFVRSEHFFRLEISPAWDSHGVGYHSLFSEWNPNGHTCPGLKRITQFHNYLMPWFKFPVVHAVNFRLHKVSEDALKVKLALYKRGYRGFIVNGPGKRVWGRGAVRAFKKFESDVGLSNDGQPDSRSLHILHFRLM